MKNIFLIPTDKPSYLVIDTIEDKLYYQPILHKKTVNVLPHFIYITNDEDIKEGWKGYAYKKDVKGEVFKHSYTTNQWYKDAKKIILTNNPTLIQDGVQAIDDEFLEWFVKNPSCESVEVIKQGTKIKHNQWGFTMRYFINIPKEETEQKLYTEEEVKELLKRFAPHIRYNHKELPHTWSQVVQEWFAENKK